MFDDLLKSGLSYERLHTLLKLSEAGSLIKAAHNDLGKQSRLSHHLRELSGYFGVELTERAGKTTKLTSAGESLVQITREHFVALQAFRNQAAKIAPTLKVAAGDSLLQWLLVPAVGSIRRATNPIRFELSQLKTNDIIEQLKERRIDFGLVQADAVKEPLEQINICEQSFGIFVPQRLVPSRGMLTMKGALLNCPHATIDSEEQRLRQLNQLAVDLGGIFIPELICDSIGQCVAAVKTGVFAAVLPIQTWTPSAEKACLIVEDPALDILKRNIVLAWHPRTIEVMGSTMSKTKQNLIEALKQQSTSEHSTF